MPRKDHPKLSIKQQIKLLEDKGVQFDLVSKDAAANYLTDQIYFFKIKQFLRLFSNESGNVSNVDFAQLMELSSLDSTLRKTVLSMCLDIEHYLRVRLIKDTTYDDRIDGFQIVEEFFKSNPGVKNNVEDKKNSGINAVNEIVGQYYDDHSIWSLIEILSQKDFFTLYTLYYSNADSDLYNQNKEILSMLYPVRMLRNAAAHNNGLLCLIKVNDDEKRTKSNYSLIDYISKYSSNISKKTRDKKLSSFIIHDICAMLYVYFSVVYKPNERSSLKNLTNLVNIEMKNNADFFNNALIKTTFDFLQKALDSFCKYGIV